MNRRITHPPWCGETDLRWITMPEGEHRCHPPCVSTPTGRVVAIQNPDRHGAGRLEVRAVVDLPSPIQVRAAAGRVPGGIQRVNTAAATVTATGRGRPA